MHRLFKSNDFVVQDIVKWILLDENLDFNVNIRGSEGKSILHLAVEKSNTEQADMQYMYEIPEVRSRGPPQSNGTISYTTSEGEKSNCIDGSALSTKSHYFSNDRRTVVQ